MDPPSLINDGSFPSANASSYSLTEIWPFQLNGGGFVGETGGVLGLRRHHFGQNLAGFVETTGSGSINRDMSLDESTVTEQSGSRSGARRKRRDAASEDESSKFVSTSSGNDMQNDSDGKRPKVSGSGDENGDSKVDMEANSGSANMQAEQSTQPTERPKQDYIHVRARRGQATDSHSLAERARREKISERMKILQDLVPGCNKVIGKALVLDEIINYIQSLQHQVEFLSMKLEAVDSRIGPSIEGFPAKDYGEQTFDATGMAFNSQATREYDQGSAQDWLHMQVGSGFERAT